MTYLNRRRFLQLTGFTALPLFSGIAAAGKCPGVAIEPGPQFNKSDVWFINDGPIYKPTEYIRKLNEIDSTQPIMRDFYGEGGAINDLQKKFIDVTGKQAAIYMPSGTLANQLAISELSGRNTKVFVQETSHVYRDEADAAQKIFNKRLIPLAKGEAYFTKDDLQKSVQYHEEGEVFKSGKGGVVSIENPVRRNNGAFVPFDELKKISDYCRANDLKLHLDGARIYMASAATGKSIAEYASLFDTVYISLYKYLGAGGGAILCGPVEVIEKMSHLIKIHGGSAFSSWANGAMALHHLDGLDERLRKSALKSAELFKLLNATGKMNIIPLEKNNTNGYSLKFAPGINAKKVVGELREKHSLIFQSPDPAGIITVRINDSILLQENATIVEKLMNTIKIAV
ncbi:MAG: aminotransferase class I/II-fold pyridoxal phosphate-dependent enzyme [Ferruginibacter sp.]